MRKFIPFILIVLLFSIYISPVCYSESYVWTQALETSRSALYD